MTGLFHDPIDDRYRSTLRYLSAVAHSDDHDSPSEVASPEPDSDVLACVGDVMVRGVVAAHEDASFKEIVDALTRNHISAVPVIDGTRRVVGVVSESDLLARVSPGHIDRPRGHRLAAHREERAKRHAATARELMTSPAVVTTPDTPIDAAARIAASSRVRRLPVVDAYGVLIGIVTRTNLLRPFLRADTDILDDVKKNVIVGAFVLNPATVGVTVEEGVVTICGQVERRLLKDSLIEAVGRVSGVVDVDGRQLTYRVDDAMHIPTR